MGNHKNLSYIIMILFIVLSLTGVAILDALQNDNRLKENTVVEINGETSKTLKAEIKGLYPGKTVDYQISLSGNSAEEYSVTLRFFGDDGGTLKKYTRVKITKGNSSVEKPLEELLDGETVSLGQGGSDIKISYTMPIDTGDEAQGASVVFYVELNAKMLNDE